MKLILAILLTATLAAGAAEYHVAIAGDNANAGTAAKPLRTIQAAANLAQPGDTVTVHAGVYRERIDPPRGGTSDAVRITYQAAPGEKVIISGAEPAKGWEKVRNDTWKLSLPNADFGNFNPFAHRIQGEWCEPTGRHAGSVYLKGDWLAESLMPGPVLEPVGKGPLWFASVGGQDLDDGGHLFALKSFTIGNRKVPAAAFSAKQGELHATACADGDGQCVGWTRPGNWLAFDLADLKPAATVGIVAGALNGGGVIEFHAGTPDGELLGTCAITHTGDWQKWQSFTVPLKAPPTGTKTLFLVLGSHRTAGDHTTIWAQFPGKDPNQTDVEISKRQSVFYPSRPGINHITVRGFELCQAATPWAGAMSEQVGLVGTHWSKGWIIENNHIHHSMNTGVALGRYELPQAELPPATAPGFVTSIELALRDGWSKEKIGGHIVRNNHLQHCEKNAIHGSLGACFSEISGNEIHDISRTGWVRGADTGGIKFLGGVDMVIRDNHIHHCGNVAGIWLDWMAQGAVVTGNLLHDNSLDIFFEMQHGPLTAANNLLLSKQSILINSEGLALAHNLVAGTTATCSDPRETPYHPRHALTVAGLFTACGGGHRLYNNLFLAPFAGGQLSTGKLPSAGSGNVLAGQATPPGFGDKAVVDPGWNPQAGLIQKADGWYLCLNANPAWRAASHCQPVTTVRLGKNDITGLPYENPDGTPFAIDTDYFGKPRDPTHPFPGPFETVQDGKQELKVWPKPGVPAGGQGKQGL